MTKVKLVHKRIIHLMVLVDTVSPVPAGTGNSRSIF